MKILTIEVLSPIFAGVMDTDENTRRWCVRHMLGKDPRKLYGIICSMDGERWLPLRIVKEHELVDAFTDVIAKHARKGTKVELRGKQANAVCAHLPFRRGCYTGSIILDLKVATRNIQEGTPLSAEFLRVLPPYLTEAAEPLTYSVVVRT